jgi:transposase
VLCVDEKSQIQALDRTQPGLPLKRGRAATMTHDYKRHGTTTLFAALNVRTGLVIGDCQPRHRAKEFIRFLAKINRVVKRPLDVHLVLDNYGSHKTPEVQAWLVRHTRFHLHFTPTSASWLNLVERFFAEITTKRIRRGAFKSVAELEDAIDDYLMRHNADPKLFVWTKPAGDILARERRALDKAQSAPRGPSVRVATLAVKRSPQRANLGSREMVRRPETSSQWAADRTGRRCERRMQSFQFVQRPGCCIPIRCATVLAEAAATR